MKLTDVFGDTKQVRIIEFIIDNPNTEFNKADIARATNSNWGTANTKMDTGTPIQSMLTKTKTFGRGTYYKANKQNKLYKQIKKIQDNRGN